MNISYSLHTIPSKIFSFRQLTSIELRRVQWDNSTVSTLIIRLLCMIGLMQVRMPLDITTRGSPQIKTWLRALTKSHAPYMIRFTQRLKQVRLGRTPDSIIIIHTNRTLANLCRFKISQMLLKDTSTTAVSTSSSLSMIPNLSLSILRVTSTAPTAVLGSTVGSMRLTLLLTLSGSLSHSNSCNSSQSSPDTSSTMEQELTSFLPSGSTLKSTIRIKLLSYLASWCTFPMMKSLVPSIEPWDGIMSRELFLHPPFTLSSTGTSRLKPKKSRPDSWEKLSIMTSRFVSFSTILLASLEYLSSSTVTRPRKLQSLSFKISKQWSMPSSLPTSLLVCLLQTSAPT